MRHDWSVGLIAHATQCPCRTLVASYSKTAPRIQRLPEVCPVCHGTLALIACIVLWLSARLLYAAVLRERGASARGRVGGHGKRLLVSVSLKEAGREARSRVLLTQKHRYSRRSGISTQWQVWFGQTTPQTTCGCSVFHVCGVGHPHSVSASNTHRTHAPHLQGLDHCSCDCGGDHRNGPEPERVVPRGQRHRG